GSAQAGAGRLDHRRVEADREQPAREVLFAHSPRPKAAPVGGGELAAAVDRHLARRPPFRNIGSVMRMEHWWFTAPLRLKSILRGRHVERELDEELQFHLDSNIEEGVNR